jgi:nitrate reductase (NAD(P)H)
MIYVSCCVGGGKKVTRVEVTLDGGETWLLCELNHPEKPNKYGKYWCWCFWSIDVEVIDLLGAKEIAVRAWDQSLNTQPEKLVWNLMVRGVDRLAHHSVFFFFFACWILKF